MTSEIREYTEDGRSPYEEWFNGLDEATAAGVNTYVRRLEAGNFGAAKALHAGVFEARMGFRAGISCVLWARGPDDHNPIIILLGGGTKRRQGNDIAAAVARWKRYKATRE